MGSLETNIISRVSALKHETQSKLSLLNLDYSHRKKKKKMYTLWKRRMSKQNPDWLRLRKSIDICRPSEEEPSSSQVS